MNSGVSSSALRVAWIQSMWKTVRPRMVVGLVLCVILCGLSRASAQTDTTQAAAGPATTASLPGTPAQQSSAVENTLPGNGQSPTQGNGPTLQLSPMMQLKALEPDANEEYTLAGGDEISILVAGRPELSGKYVVGPDGRISLPDAGTLDVGGLTREQANKAIDKAYGQYFKLVSTTVSIDKYGSNRVMVIGAVEHPGYVTFDQAPMLLEAITRAGLVEQVKPQGALAAAAAAPIKSLSDSIPEEVQIYRGPQGNQQVFTVRVRDLLASSNAMGDLRLRRNDVIVVPDQKEKYITLMGEVKVNGPVVLTRSSTLATVIAQAGGFTENAGANPTIEIVDPLTQKERLVKFKELLTPQGATEILLRPGELIYIPKSGLAKAGYFFQQLSPFTSMMGIAAIAAAR